MDFKDYYKIMGLERNVAQDEIKRAYRKLARKYHPDVSKEADAESKFKELGEAYEVLRDPEKRAKYDKFGQYWQQPEQQAHGYNQRQQPGGGPEAADFEEFLNSIFRQRYQQQEAAFNRGQDIHAKLTISLEDSFAGTQTTLQLQTPVVGKQGYMEYQQRAIKVKIPKGIGDKQQIRLKGQGEKGPGGHAGDLYIEITIAPHPLYRLDNKDLYLDVPITPWEATLGASITVPTLAGPVTLKIPKSAQSGKQMRLKGRGLPGSHPGDQYIILNIVIPTTEDQEVNKLYEQIAKISQFNPREKLGAVHGR